MIAEKDTKTLISRFPGSLEAVGWRKGTQDFGVTYSVPQELREYVKPLMDKLNKYFIIASVEVRDTQQAEQILKAQGDEIDSLPAGKGGQSKEDQDRYCSMEEIASMLSMTPRSAFLYAQKGVIVKVGRGRYDLTQSIQNYIKEIRNEQRSGGRRGEVLAEKEEIQKERLLVKLLTEKKKLVIAEDCVREVEKNNFNVRNKLLRLPTKLAPLIAGNKKPSEIKEIMEDHVRECLTELAGINPPRMGDSASKQSVRSATKIKSKRVGRHKKSTKLNKR